MFASLLVAGLCGLATLCTWPLAPKPPTTTATPPTATPTTTTTTSTSTTAGWVDGAVMEGYVLRAEAKWPQLGRCGRQQGAEAFRELRKGYGERREVCAGRAALKCGSKLASASSYEPVLRGFGWISHAKREAFR